MWVVGQAGDSSQYGVEFAAQCSTALPIWRAGGSFLACLQSSLQAGDKEWRAADGLRSAGEVDRVEPPARTGCVTNRLFGVRRRRACRRQPPGRDPAGAGPLTAPASRRSPVSRSRALWPVAPASRRSRLAAIRQVPPPSCPPFARAAFTGVVACGPGVATSAAWPRSGRCRHAAPARPDVRPCRVHGRKWRPCGQWPGVATWAA